MLVSFAAAIEGGCHSVLKLHARKPILKRWEQKALQNLASANCLVNFLIFRLIFKLKD